MHTINNKRYDRHPHVVHHIPQINSYSIFLSQILRISLVCCIMLLSATTFVHAQNIRNSLNPYLNGALQDGNRESGFSNDSIEHTDVPEGIYAWHIDPRFGDIASAPYDTIPHGFQNDNQTYGKKGHYNFTGNLGAPRVSRFFSEQGANMRVILLFLNCPTIIS